MFYKVFYTDKFIPKGLDACTRSIVVLIRPSFKNDISLLKHELTHVKQFYRNPLHALFYNFSKSYRLKCEIEAYKEQLKYCHPININHFAYLISNNYNLDITIEEAKTLLQS